jgi:DNA repair exonuclease SbcCD nuclease subunit
MKRKNRKKSSVTAILSSDWHIRGDRPVCRTDDYMEAQRKKITFILNLAKDNSCPILVAGDFGHKPMWGDRLLNYFIDILNDFQDVVIYVVVGQHDLPNHRLDKWKEAGLGVLDKQYGKDFEVIVKPTRANDFIIFPFHYSNNIIKLEQETTDRTTALLHTMVIKSQKEKLWHDQVAHSAKWYLRKFPCYDLIVSGDNHQSFAIEYEGRWLVNAGSLMRMTANQIEHKPSVYLWYAEDNSIERIYLPIEENVVSRQHIAEGQQRNERIEAYINRLKETEELGLSYESNMKEFFKTNRTRRKIMLKVWESMK